MSLSFKVKVRHDASFAEAVARVEAYPPRLDAAMRRGTERGTRVLASAVERMVVSRTSMGQGVAARITNSEVLPGVGPVSRGRVWFEKPPDRIYAKKGGALRFKIGGREIVVKSVKGSRPYPLIERAADATDTGETIEGEYAEEIEEVL